MLFRSESEIRKAINSKRYSDKVGFRWMIAQIARVLLVKFRLAYRSNDAEIRKNISEDYSKILTCFERDLFSLKAIADGHGSSLTFFLQPLATWLDKTLSLEEQQLFEYLDDLVVAGDITRKAQLRPRAPASSELLDAALELFILIGESQLGALTMHGRGD